MGNTNTAIPFYRRKIDTEGNYLPFPGYTIVSHAIHSLPKPLTDLVDYLSSSELRQYYSFLPSTSYHVTINPLENVRDEHKSLLNAEQLKLHEQNTSTICTADKLIYSRVIALEVQFNDDDNHTFEHMIRNVRSDQLQQANILHNYTRSWHLTLAHQYKESESNEMKSKLDQIIEHIPPSSKFPFNISLDQIRICQYDDMTKFTPI